MAPSINLPVPRNELYKKSVFYLGATLWNQLPVELRLHDNIYCFKSELHKYIV